MTIEERIQELRKIKGLSQEQLADILGVSRQAVSKWESGQSLPEIEKLITMSELFEVTVDYMLKGESLSRQNGKRRDMRLRSQIVSAIGTMLLAWAIYLAFGGSVTSDGPYMDIYNGLMAVIIGVTLVLIGLFLAGGKIINKPLFVTNILLAGVLPSMFIFEIFLRFYPRPISYFSPIKILVLAGSYFVICGSVICFALLRKKR